MLLLCNNFNSMDNLKAQTHSVLSKILQQLNRQKQQDEKNHLPNPENEPVPVTCKQLLDLYSHNLQAKQKMLAEVALANDLALEMNTIQLKTKIGKAIGEMSIDNNEFNIPESELPKTLINMNKTIQHSKVKKISQAKKTEPSVEAHPQYFRVDHEICHKLFQHYRSLPLGIPKHGGINFQQKQHHKLSMNYHKILQIFKDSNINLEINQKLLILRSIKKFCFNQNFINIDQFIKVFKVIVHGLGFKEQMFEQFMKKNASLKQSKVAKNMIPKPRRNYRFKTDNSMQEQRTNLNPLSRQTMNMSISDDKRQLLAQLTSQDKKGMTKQSGKKIVNAEGVNSTASYLAKAMENQRISKITWQSLFNMKESSMHNFIVIPSFVRNVNLDQF